MKLTQRRIDDLECPAEKKDRLYFDEEQRGLGVRVTATGSKTYLAQYVLSGKKRRIGLGHVSCMPLSSARDAVAKILGEVAQGRDPARERLEARREAQHEAAREALTLEELLRQWEEIRLSARRESYAAEAVRAVRYAFSKQLMAPAADLRRQAVVRVLDALTADGKAAMAARTAAYGRACYGWAIKRGSLTDNPFAALPLETVDKRDRVLSDDELRAVWHATEGQGAFNAIVRALILTGQRREEVAGMAWGEISGDLSSWTLPAERAKNGVVHIVPISPQLRAHIEQNGFRAESGDGGGKSSAFVFPGRDGQFNGFGKAKAALDEACGVADWRLHDLRRTVATGLQRLGVRLEVTEAILNHVSGTRGGIAGVYQRYHWTDEKRAALDAWSAHVAEIVEGRSPATNVVELRRGTV